MTDNTLRMSLLCLVIKALHDEMHDGHRAASIVLCLTDGDTPINPQRFAWAAARSCMSASMLWDLGTIK